MSDFCGQCAKTDCGIYAAYKKYVADEKKKKEEEKKKSKQGKGSGYESATLDETR